MKVLLTGANGFVGSHVLESLLTRGLSTAVLLRKGADTSFVRAHLAAVEVRSGSILDPSSVIASLKDVTHVIHCAGATRAIRPADFYTTNQQGTRNVVEAINAHPGVQRLVHISSLAAGGPAAAAAPAREQDPPRPVSEYGRSKLEGELEVRRNCKTEFVIVRPPAVYGPRDRGFLSMFKAVSRHVRPQPSAAQALSVVFAKDLAEVIVGCLNPPARAGRIYYAASTEIITARQMAAEMARHARTWTLPCPLPVAMLWPICLLSGAVARLTRRPSLLNLQKFAELRAPGWVCDSSLLRQDTGQTCPTRLHEGVGRTLAWYRENRWL